MARSRRVVLLLVPTLVLLLAGVGVYLRFAEQPLHAWWVGCLVRHADDTCELSERPDEEWGRSTLRLWTDAPAGTFFEVRSDAGRLEHGILPTSDGHLVEIVVPPGAGTITVHARRGRDRWRTRLTIVEGRTPKWLLDARNAWIDDHNPEAEAILAAHPPASPFEEALATSLRAHILWDAGRFEDASVAFERAIAADHAAGLTAAEADDTIWRSIVVGQDLGRFGEATELLQRSKAVGETPEHAAWRELNLPILSFRRGKLPDALAVVLATPKWTGRLRGPFMMSELALFRSGVLASLGRLRAAHEALDAIPAESLPVCRRAYILSRRGELDLQLVEESGDTASALKDYAPDRPFAEALSLRRRECKQVPQIAGNLTSLARAALLRGDERATEHYLDDPEARPKEGLSAGLVRAQQEVRAGLLLIRRDFAGAEEAFRALATTANRLAKEGDLEARDLRIRALLGLVRATWDVKRDMALQVLDEMRESLEADCVSVPFGEGRLSTLGRRRRQVGELLDYLVKAEKLEAAGDEMRRIRVCGLRDLSFLPQVARLDDAKRAALVNEYTDYERRRAEYESLREQYGRVPVAEQSSIGQEVARAKRGIEEHLASITRADDIAPIRYKPRAPKPGEVIVSCHPVPGRLLCIATAGPDRRMIRAQYLPSLDGRLPPSELERRFAWLGPLVANAQEVTILTDGAMRRIDFGALRIDGRPLSDERRTVVYELDMPQLVKAAAPARKKAVVIIDPSGQTDEGVPLWEDAVRPWLDGWDVISQVGPSFKGIDGQAQRRQQALGGEELARELPDAGVFVYFGENDRKGVPSHVFGGRGDRLLLDGVEWNVMAMLGLRRAPPLALIFRCGPLPDDGEQNDFDALELPIALALRGAEWVVATSRPVRADVAAALARQLMRHGSTFMTDPAGAFIAARTAVLRDASLAAKKEKIGVAETLDAFRLYRR